MKKVAVVLIVFGSGLIAFGLSGFSGDLGVENVRFQSDNEPYKYSGSFQWPMNNRLEITVGVISLVSGALLQKNSK